MTVKPCNANNHLVGPLRHQTKIYLIQTMCLTPSLSSKRRQVIGHGVQQVQWGKLTILLLISWKWISQTFSTTSSFSNVTKPKPEKGGSRGETRIHAPPQQKLLTCFPCPPPLQLPFSIRCQGHLNYTEQPRFHRLYCCSTIQNCRSPRWMV